jgi:hypothetical protein
MSKANEGVSLDTLETLVSIVSALKETNEDALSATNLKRTASVSKINLDEALNHGCNIKVLQKHERNYYSLKVPYSTAKNYVVPEESYYTVVENCISELWRKEGFEASAFYIEDTSRKDSKIVGRWTRPDLTLVSHRKFPWMITSEFDVVTFEVKRPDSADVLAVFEALSHSATATRAYVVFPINHEDWKSRNPEQERRVCDECSRHGVGLILVEQHDNKRVANHLIKAARREIDPEKCSSFLDAVVTPEGKKSISRWQ